MHSDSEWTGEKDLRTYVTTPVCARTSARLAVAEWSVTEACLLTRVSQLALRAGPERLHNSNVRLCMYQTP